MSKDYNATINLPKTDFPMRAGLPKREPDMLKKWEADDIYNEALKKSEGKPRFNLHDGPPFSNGDIHMGHALNKALKDFINRSYMCPTSPAGTTTACPSRARSSRSSASTTRT